jgi:hypothetical protein
MKGHHVARYLFCLLVVLLFAGLSAAQSSDHVEVFGGYSYVNPDFTSSVSKGVSGWDLSATANIVRYAGIVADFSGFSPAGANPCSACSSGPFATYHTFSGGPQVSIGIGRIKPFAHFLIGTTWGSFTHVDSQFGGNFSDITYGAGGGVDLRLDRWFALRGQADWLRISFQGSSNVARVSTGVVFRF